MTKPGAASRSPRPGFFRRIAAIAYDSLLLLGILFVATAILLPFNGGQALTGEHFFYPFYLLVISFIFFGWFWTHGGQTLGMRAWKFKVLTREQKPINWRQALLRFCGALISWLMLGCGFLWIFTNRKREAWHDRFSGSGLFFEQSKKHQRNR